MRYARGLGGVKYQIFSAIQSETFAPSPGHSNRELAIGYSIHPKIYITLGGINDGAVSSID